MSVSYDEIKAQATKACEELVETAKLQKGDIFVIGCSSSEVVGLRIGKGSDINAAKAVYEGVMSVLQPRGIYLAAQKKKRCFRERKSSMLYRSRMQEVLLRRRSIRMRNVRLLLRRSRQMQESISVAH